MIQARGAALEEGSDNYKAIFANQFAQRGGGGAGDGLGEVEEGVVLALAKVLRAEEFGQADKFGARLGGLAHAGDGLGEVSRSGGLAGHLDEGDAGGVFRHKLVVSLIGIVIVI